MGFRYIDVENGTLSSLFKVDNVIKVSFGLPEDASIVHIRTMRGPRGKPLYRMAFESKEWKEEKKGQDTKREDCPVFEIKKREREE